MSKFGSTIKSLGKVLLQSRRTSLPRNFADKRLIILANGPSLRDTLDTQAEILRRNTTMSVNFAPNTPEFFDIKPRFHVLADPLFFSAEPMENVRHLYDNLSRVDWPFTLLVPRSFAKKLPASISANANIEIGTFNFVGLEGYEGIEHALYGMHLGMPRPRNVLIPALMCGIWMNFKTIYIVGADHSWMQTISVDDDNNVISVQPHYYKDGDGERRRVDTAYRNYRLDQIVESFAIAFRSYHRLQRYATKKGVEIFNSTPGSFIDAFPRHRLPTSADD